VSKTATIPLLAANDGCKNLNKFYARPLLPRLFLTRLGRVSVVDLSWLSLEEFILQEKTGILNYARSGTETPADVAGFIANKMSRYPFRTTMIDRGEV